MTPAPSFALPFISQEMLAGFLRYLSELFSTPRTKESDEYAINVLKEHPAKDSRFLRRSIFQAGEQILKDICDGKEAAKIYNKDCNILNEKIRKKKLYDILSKCTSEKGFLSYTCRYKGAHTTQIIIPRELTEYLGWDKKEVVSVVERDGTFYIRTTRPDEMHYVTTMRPIDMDGIVRGGRYLYLTKHQRAALNIGTELYSEGVNLKCTFDLVKTHTITVEPLKPEENALPTIPRDRRYLDEFYASVRTVKRHVTGPFILPVEFCRKYEIQKDDVVGVKTEKGKLTIYGRKDACGFCGDLHDKGSLKTVPLCPDCADAIDTVQETIKKARSIKAAVEESRKQLDAAIKKLDGLEI